MNIQHDHRRIVELINAGVKVQDINKLGWKRFLRPAKKFDSSLPSKLPLPLLIIYKVVRRLNLYIYKFSDFIRKVFNFFILLTSSSTSFSPMASLNQILGTLRPDLVVICQGDNFDGLSYMNICQSLGLDYVIISQKASDLLWPPDHIRSALLQGYQTAKSCFFVSQHNLQLTEAQLGKRLPQAEVVRNPHQAIITESLPWPVEADHYRLACVARFWILDKGQDILLNVLAQDKWRKRNLKIDFFGQGCNYDSLLQLAELWQLPNVGFPGFSNNIVELWRNYHALILPSRAEGLPLALVEAMMCGRPAIATAVGGVSEVVLDNVTGFIASGACFAALDEAMERAWQRRHEWEAIGKTAATSIRQHVPHHPEQVFAEKLQKLSQIQKAVIATSKV